MSVVLDLNDQALNLYRDGQLIASSPGYALAQGSVAQFGAEAAAQSRLHPVSTNNEFWYRLSMDPLSRPFANFRHYADMAHAHLAQLASICDFEGPVALTVPGSYSREQLGILSGIIRHSPFTVRAMADSGLVAAAAMAPQHQHLVIVDMQLHQSVLTLVSAGDGRLRRDKVVVANGIGSSSLSNTIVQTVNDAFIAQCRFNPQHSAQWEQQLYNDLPGWLAAIRAGATEIKVEIATDRTRHQATVLVADMQGDLMPALGKLDQQLQSLCQFATSVIPVIASTRAALIPGLLQHIKASPETVGGEQMARVCAQLASELTDGSASVPYITSIRLDQASAADAAVRDPATHLLIDGYAWPLTAQQYLTREEVEGLLDRHGPGDTIERDGKRMQLIRVQHGVP